jgi:hypothetical protein
LAAKTETMSEIDKAVLKGVQDIVCVDSELKGLV